MTGLHVRDFAQLIVRPVLRGGAEVTGRQHIYSKAAERLLLGTAIQESRLRHLRQRARADGRRGPALGLFQIEPSTHADRWINYIRHREDLSFWFQQMIPWHEGTLQIAEQQRGGKMFRLGFPVDSFLVWNLAYAVAMARTIYLPIKEPLPDASDLAGLGRYWKRHYNTTAGAGKGSEFVRHYVENTPADVFGDDLIDSFTLTRGE